MATIACFLDSSSCIFSRCCRSYWWCDTINQSINQSIKQPVMNFYSGPSKKITSESTEDGWVSYRSSVIMSGKEAKNRNVFRCRWKVERDGAEMTLSSRLFHIVGPATEKAGSSTVGSLTDGTSRWLVRAEQMEDNWIDRQHEQVQFSTKQNQHTHHTSQPHPKQTAV